MQDFRAGSFTHAAVICVVFFIAAAIALRGERASGVGLKDKKTARFVVGMLYAICALVFLRNLRHDRFGWYQSLPLHICDITGLMAAVAIQTGNRLARNVLHFWGLALSSQAFLFPVVEAGPIHSDFWLYWIRHASIVLTAVYDLAVLGYQPTWRDWRHATLLLAGYAMVVLPIDVLLDVNYGYLGQTIHGPREAIAAFGPWPQRLPVLWFAAIVMMALLMVRIPNLTARQSKPAMQYN